MTKSRVAMSPIRRLRGTLAAVSLALAALLTLVNPCAAQFTLESMTPAHGAENVELAQPLVLTFSQPIDTAAAFESAGGFYLGIQVLPDPGPPETLTLSEDRTQLTAQLTLAENTQYWVALTGAKAESGEELDHPYSWTFSTGTLPTASMSGTVSFDGSNPQGAIVGLFPTDFFGGMFGDDGGDDGPQFRAVTVVTGPDGVYTIDFVPSGTFLPGAFRDTDHDGEPNAGVQGEGLGFFDPDENRVADNITIAEGEQVEGIDVVIGSVAATAGENLDDVVLLARESHDDAVLTGIQGGDLTVDGATAIWLYMFYSAASGDTTGVALFFDYLFPIESLPFGGDDGPFDPTVPLPDGWIDSPQAVGTAEDAGGQDFREGNPGTVITAGLFMLDLPGGEALAKRRASFQRQPVWVVSYSSPPSPGELRFVVDALTGEIVLVSGARTSAESEFAKANQAGIAWQPDAELVFVGSLGSVDAAGRSGGWAFAYYSPALDELHTVFVSGGIVFDERPASPDDVPSTLPLPGNWADSDVAAAAAEAASDGFRDQYPEAEVFARLSHGFPGVRQDRLLWEFTFHPAPQGEILLRILVDGLTGAVTTSTEPSGLPGSVSLLEAYPNPSTGPTSIRYGLEATGTVELIVMNALGQVVRSILSDSQPAGVYTVPWDGTDDRGAPVASGNYWLRLKSEAGVRLVSVVVIRP